MFFLQILPNLHFITHLVCEDISGLVTMAQLVVTWQTGGRGFKHGLEPEMFLAENIPIFWKVFKITFLHMRRKMGVSETIDI